MTDAGPPVVGALTFADARAFKGAHEQILRGGVCFLVGTRPQPAGTGVLVELTVGDEASFRLNATATAFHDDGAGAAGLIVTLEPGALASLEQLYKRLSAPRPPDETTTQRDDDGFQGSSPSGLADTRITTSSVQAPTMLLPAPTGEIAEAELVDEEDELYQSSAGFAAAKKKVPTLAMPAAAEGQVLAPGTVVEGRFTVERHLASGGMGEVYRATHVFLKRPVALKLLKRTFAQDADMWARFQREAELVSQLESPNIVRVFDFGRTAEGDPFLAMELVEGVTLDVLLERERTLTPDRAVSILCQVCEGLAEAHVQNIIHRDLKPANIILGKRRDGSEVAKILDFGIARLADARASSVTQIGMVVGTPAYISPEQALADALDPRTDLYSLGCVAFELLTGRAPFKSDSLQQLIAAHLHQPPPLPQSIRQELWLVPDLCGAVLKALAKQREERFPDVRAFANALRAGLANRAASASAMTGAGPAAAPPGNWSRPPPAPAAGAWGASAEAQWPPPEPAWPPPNPSGPMPSPAPSTPPPRADGFFSELGLGAPVTAAAKGAGAPPPLQAALQQALSAQRVALSPEVLAQLSAERGALVAGDHPGVAFFAEVLGPPLGSPLRAAALARVLEHLALAHAAVDALDEDGVQAFFQAAEGDATPARAALCAQHARDAVAHESAAAGQRAALRVGLVLGRASSGGSTGPLKGDSLRGSRALGTSVPGGVVAAGSALAAALESSFELAPAPAQAAGALVVGEKKSLLARTAVPVIGRDALFGALEKRLEVLGRAIAPPFVVAGHMGAGRTTVAQEVARQARRAGHVVASARGSSAFRERPYGALVEMLCGVLGLERTELQAKLLPALTKLGIAGAVLEAVLVVAGVRPTPTPLTPGAAVHALREVLQAGGAGRSTVLLFDGLETMDRRSADAFAELAAHARSGELVVGTAEPDFARSRFAQVPTMALSGLHKQHTRALMAAMLQGVPPDDELLAHVHTHGRGLPGLVLDWLSVLDEVGALRRTPKGIALAGAAPTLEAGTLALERVRMLPNEARALLEAVVVVGDVVSTDLLAALVPGVGRATYEKLVLGRFLRSLGKGVWGVGATRIEKAVQAYPTAGTAALHVRYATALVDAARVAGTAPDSLTVAQHLAAGGDAQRALGVWKHAVETAVARRSAADLGDALKGLADVLGQVPWGKTPDGQRLRVESLARATINALGEGDSAAATGLHGEAQAAAKAAGISSAELSLATAKVLRGEARRARAAAALEEALKLAGAGPVAALALAERADVLESEGDLAGAVKALQSALAVADGAREVAALHGEVDLKSRLQARLAAVLLRRKQSGEAVQQLMASALAGWRKAAWPWAEARVLANLGTSAVAEGKLADAAKTFNDAAAVAGRCGDLLFMARQFLNAARVMKKAGNRDGAKATAKQAREAAALVLWAEGVTQAQALEVG